MSPIVNETVKQISTCEIYAVKDANNWKFIKNNHFLLLKELKIRLKNIKYIIYCKLNII